MEYPRINYVRADGTHALRGDIYCDTSEAFAIGDMLANREREPLAMLVTYPRDSGRDGRTTHLLTPTDVGFSHTTVRYLYEIRDAFLAGV